MENVKFNGIPPHHETAIVSITWSDRDFTPESNDVMKMYLALP